MRHFDLISASFVFRISLLSVRLCRSSFVQRIIGPDSFGDFFKELLPIGSIAYKLAMVSANQADLVASLKPKNEWDICAGHCLINESGGILVTSEGNEIKYNNRNTLITPGLVAGNKDAVNNMLNCIRNV